MTDDRITLHYGDCIEVMPTLEAASVQLVVTSPPYAMMRADRYGGIEPAAYPAWWMSVMDGVDHVLAPGGSVVINWQAGRDGHGSKLSWDVRSLIAMLDGGWTLRDEYAWDKETCVPGAYSWAFASRWERILHMTRSGEEPHAWNKKDVRAQRQSFDSITANRQGSTVRNPSGWDGRIRSASAGPMAYPSNVLRITKINDDRHTDVGGNHPAMFPTGVPRFFIRLLTNPGERVQDPFAGSGTTCAVALEEGRRTIGIELHETYFAHLEARFKRIQRTLLELQGEGYAKD